jgi:hypothetical protein
MRRLEMTLSAALFVSTLMFTGCVPVLDFGPAVTATEKLALPSKGETKLDVQSLAGSVTYIGDLNDKLEVVAEKRAQTEEALANIKVSFTSKDGLISLGWSNGEAGVQVNRSVNLTIHGPKHLAAKMKLGAGGIKVTGLDGDLSLETGAGSIDVVGGGTKIDLNTGAGEISAAGLDGTLHAETNAGAVHVTGKLRGDNVVKTGAGEVTVTVPAASRLKVDASTGAGKVSADFGPESVGPKSSRVVIINDGGDGTLKMHSGAGRVWLQKLD